MSDTSPAENIISRKDFTKSYKPDKNVLIDAEIRMSTPAFTIDKADYFLLTKSVSGLSDAGNKLLILFVGIALPLLVRSLFAYMTGTGSDIKPWEYGTVCLVLVLVIILHALGVYLPNERRSLLNRMKQHFDKAASRIESHRRQ